METDFVERMKNVLCPLHNKKIQFLNLEMNATHFFICGDCLLKNKRYCVENMDFFLSVEDFKNVYLRKMRKELELMKDSIVTHMNHIENHIRNGEASIEDDYDKITKIMTQYVKLMLKGYKNTMISKFREANKVNHKALENIRGQIGLMLDESNGIISKLNGILNTQIENSSLLQTLIQGRLRVT
jgi:hypothetical protein